jgi:holliday junction DNA helicase RuvA
MLAFIRGSIIHKNNNSIIIETNDLGYRIFVADRIIAQAKTGHELELYLHHHIKEDSHDLYGFENTDELELFEQLISISGIGPKTALSALNLASALQIRQAIARGDASLLKQVSGIGPKTAERIVVELKDKFRTMKISAGDDQNANEDGEVIEALVGLGYTVMQARVAVNQLPSTVKGVQERIKAALRTVGKF